MLNSGTQLLKILIRVQYDIFMNKIMLIITFDHNVYILMLKYVDFTVRVLSYVWRV